MTAEIAVLNRVGVALAADSAVTIGPSGDKIWTSADKLFQLSEVDPIGIMVYGSADFVGIPWETIIKTYRREHGNESLETVRDHANRFFAFVAGNQLLFPTARQDAEALDLIAVFWFQLRDLLKKTLDREAEVRNGLEESEIPGIISDEIASSVRRMRETDAIAGMSVVLRGRLRAKYAGSLEKLFDTVFGQLPMARSARRALFSLAVLMLTRQWLSGGHAGIVFAGFGKREYLPALHAFELESMVEHVPRIGKSRSRQIDGDSSIATIVPFAQQEMVHSFMRGVDPRLFTFMQRSSRELFDKTFNAILSLVQSAAPDVSSKMEELRPKLEALTDALFADWETQQEEYWDPVVSNIGTLPKDELASMAEAFVNLTKFRRRVTNERETVGGPIDVAVITKGDGFIWVKRKHYFDAELNPRYMAQYGRR
jgi:hypothetical protein